MTVCSAPGHFECRKLTLSAFEWSRPLLFTVNRTLCVKTARRYEGSCAHRSAHEDLCRREKRCVYRITSRVINSRFLLEIIKNARNASNFFLLDSLVSLLSPIYIRRAFKIDRVDRQTRRSTATGVDSRAVRGAIVR